MTLNQVMAQLEKWGSEKARELYKRHGAGDQQFGVNRSNLRNLAKQIKPTTSWRSNSGEPRTSTPCSWLPC